MVQVVPVIDLMHGQVVRGIAGQRQSYRPIQSPLVDGSDPVAVARALRATSGVRQLYLADLDAIAGQAPAWDIYRQLADDGCQLWIDAGLSDVPRLAALADFAAQCSAVAGLLAGLESLPSWSFLRRIVEQLRPEQVIFSLDLMRGQPLTQVPDLQRWSPDEIADQACHLGINRVLVLDLAQVGVSQGVGTWDLLARLHARHPQLALIGGGGVRSLDDLQLLHQSGCQQVLVASALHDGRLNRADLQLAASW